MLLIQLAVAIGLLPTTLATCRSLEDRLAPLIQELSAGATVQFCAENQRWSEYAAPQPGAVITVGEEEDVPKIVKFAAEVNLSFLLQSGANGWANTFTLDASGIIIDVSVLKAITFNDDRTQVTFQTGVTNADMINAAWSANARVSVSTCNCVSLLGATLGGGLSRTQGLYGLDADQAISLDMVDANGSTRTVTLNSDADLWWALKGAGANFGIITSGVFKSYPIPQAENTAWTGIVVFDPSKIEQVMSALNNLTLEPEMEIDLYYSVFNGQPAFLMLPFYLGGLEMGRQKFASILDIGPLVDDTEVIPYNTWNAAGDFFCARGSRKPSYTSALQTMDPAVWRTIWNEYTSFVAANPEAINTTILVECYSTPTQGENESSFPFRDSKCFAIAIPWYANASLDEEANAFGRNVRSLWQEPDGTSPPRSYINFAHGDEQLSEIYGASLPRLQALKNKYDPDRRFNQWFPLSDSRDTEKL
ncbi:FAD binding domain-containing protein [Xylaria scruposa]|nr:FAD binding domain-containing protein [Xylaria scruposa]